MFVPAIGADPRKTWERQTGSNVAVERHRLDYVLKDKLHPTAQVHLYDHLTERERSLAVKPSRGPNDLVHVKSAEDFAVAESEVADYGVAEWADRFLRILRDHRQTQGTDQRPILFVCHSTGGIVVKHVLSRKPDGEKIAAACLSVTFFATPHHGSSVLSEPEFVQTVRNHLGLKWEMPEALRRDFTLRNNDLETLNNKFALNVVGVKIYSYNEISDTHLLVPTNDSSGETLTPIRQCFVDSRSGRLSTTELPFEDEEIIPLNTTHVGAPIFQDENILYGYYIDEIAAFVKGFRADERAAYHALNNDIMTGTEVDVHQFYAVGTPGEPGSMKILTAHPSLQTFLDCGPAECMQQRLRGDDDTGNRAGNGSIRPAIELKPASGTSAPTLTITSVDSEDAFSNASGSPPTPTLSPPPIPQPKNIHTRRPSLTPDVPDAKSPRTLFPETAAPKKPTKSVQYTEQPHKDMDQIRRPQRTHLFPLPSSSSERFKWIHVPFCHAGWVPHVLTTVSQEKNDPGLHTTLLMDKMWFSQHNRSRHASSHARFVRPMAKCLSPRGAERSDGMATPIGTHHDVQFIVYMPYLHWDTFKNMQKQSAMIKQRIQQAHARPVIQEVAESKSLEHKVIWQHLTSDRPVHCRRTLDQYGYPSLRNTSVRDGDQILYKRTKPEADPQISKDAIIKNKLHSNRSLASRRSGTTNTDEFAARVLMVDQLWLWIMDSQTVITFFAPKEKENNDNGLWREGDLRSEIYQDINGDFANQCADPFDFAALAVMHAVKALLEGTTDGNLQVFRIFEEYISILTEQQTSSFKHFRNNHGFEKAKDINAQQHIDNSKDLDALLELRDIEDELNTIDKLVKEQQSCVSEMHSQYEQLTTRYGKGHNGFTWLTETSQFLADHHEQVDGMLKSTRAAQRAFKDLLDMKQKQANM